MSNKRNGIYRSIINRTDEKIDDPIGLFIGGGSCIDKSHYLSNRHLRRIHTRVPVVVDIDRQGRCTVEIGGSITQSRERCVDIGYGTHKNQHVARVIASHTGETRRRSHSKKAAWICHGQGYGDITRTGICIRDAHCPRAVELEIRRIHRRVRRCIDARSIVDRDNLYEEGLLRNITGSIVDPELELIRRGLTSVVDIFHPTGDNISLAESRPYRDRNSI